MIKSIQTLLSLIVFTLIVEAQNTLELDRYFESVISPNAAAPITRLLVHLENAKAAYNYTKGFGTQSVENKIPVKAETPFKIASITKMFTATAVLQLVEEGKIKLTDRISDILKKHDFIHFNHLHLFSNQSFGEHITIKQLLNHSSGLADIFTDTESEFIDLFMSNPTKQWSPQLLFSTYYKFKLNTRAHFKPGEGFFYSDTNYFLLGLLIEEVSKQTLAEVYRSKILQPAHMNNSYFQYYEKPRHSIALSSTYLKSTELNSAVNTSFDWAGGGLISTTKDLSLFIKALFNGTLISNKELFKEMLFDNGSGYGYGINIYNFNDQIFYGHSGFWGSIIGYDPKEEKLFILSINQSDPVFSFSDLIKNSLVFMDKIKP